MVFPLTSLLFPEGAGVIFQFSIGNQYRNVYCRCQAEDTVKELFL